jgi:hypothetical protein
MQFQKPYLTLGFNVTHFHELMYIFLLSVNLLTNCVELSTAREATNCAAIR